jgi:hypothetical protein
VNNYASTVTLCVVYRIKCMYALGMNGCWGLLAAESWANGDLHAVGSVSRRQVAKAALQLKRNCSSTARWGMELRACKCAQLCVQNCLVFINFACGSLGMLSLSRRREGCV